MCVYERPCTCVCLCAYMLGCLKIDEIHLYDLLLRQAQRRLFATRPVKNASFELDDVFFNNYNISFQDMQSFFEFLVSSIHHYDINRLNLFWDSFKRFCLQISSDEKYFSSLVQGIVIKY